MTKHAATNAVAVALWGANTADSHRLADKAVKALSSGDMAVITSVDNLTSILMDMRVDSPLWKPPSTLTYGQASKELARRIIKELQR